MKILDTLNKKFNIRNRHTVQFNNNKKIDNNKETDKNRTMNEMDMFEFEPLKSSSQTWIKIKNIKDKDLFPQRLIFPSYVDNKQLFLPDDCTGLFEDMSVEILDFHNLKDVSNIVCMTAMFMGCKNLIEIIFGNVFYKAKVEYMDSMFCRCISLCRLDYQNLNTSKVKSMFSMFNGCKSLHIMNLTFDTSEVENMSFMFKSCEFLKILDISGFDMESVQNLTGMLANLPGLKEIYFPDFSVMKNMSVGDLHIITYDENVHNGYLEDSVQAVIEGRWIEPDEYEDFWGK